MRFRHMRHKKFLTLLIAPLLLTSCGKEPYVGFYSFQLGKNDGVHFGLEMNLTNDLYVPEDETKGKKFEITVNTSIFEHTDDDSEGITTDGSYTIGDSFKKGNRVTLSFTLVDDFAEIVKALLDIDYTTEDIAEFLHKVVDTYVDSKNFYFNIPVSMDDLYLQLYWYGIDIHNDSGNVEEVTAHEIGTHPTAEDITTIDAIYYGKHKDSKNEEYIHFRDFHSVEIGLAKK